MARHGAGSVIGVLHPSGTASQSKKAPKNKKTLLWDPPYRFGGGNEGTAMHMKKRSKGSDRPGGAAIFGRFVGAKTYGLQPEERKKVDRSKQPASMGDQRSHVPINKGAPRGPKYHGHLDKGKGYI